MNTKLIKAISIVASILVMLGALSLSAPAGAARLAYSYEGVSPGCSLQSSLMKLTIIAQGSAPDTAHPCSAGASFFYFFDVLSNTSAIPFAQPVPILISTTLITKTTGDVLLYGYQNPVAGASAMFSFNGPGITVCSPCIGTANAESFSGDIAGTAYTGDNYNNSVEVQANIQIGGSSSGPATAYAFADPYIRIDPAFQATHPDYYLAFSSNVTNAAPVPVPAAAWLFGSGLLGLVGVAQKSRRQSEDSPKSV